MPRNYTRKTEIASYTSDNLQNALDAIRNNGKKIRETGRHYKIPESTLRKKLSENVPTPSRLGRKATFTKEIETDLKDYVLMLAKLFYGLTPKELRRLAFRYAEQNNISHNFNVDKGLAGKDWLYGFLKRNAEIKLRQPEGTSLNRISSFNAEATQLFYSNIQTLMQKFKFEPNRIYNIDETGITTVQKKCPKVYGPKGAKKVGAAISGERGRTITAVFCMSAAGNYIPPMLIYPRKRMPPTLQKNGPIGASYKCSKNGWINTELFLSWLSHFAKHAKPTAADPILLVLDNHSSHISIASYEFCKGNNIHMVSLPPHTSDHLQPLDLTFFSPLKNALYREYDLHLTTTGHQKITEYDVAELLNKAFMKVATIEKAVSGFRSAGICPFNPDKFGEEDFAAANQVREYTIEEAPETPDALDDRNRDGPPLPEPQQRTPPRQEPQQRTPPRQELHQHSPPRLEPQQHTPPKQDPQPSTSKCNSFFALAPIPKKKKCWKGKEIPPKTTVRNTDKHTYEG